MERQRLANQKEAVAQPVPTQPEEMPAACEGKEFKLEADSVIMSVGYNPAPIAEKSKHVHIIGDAKAVGNLRTVIWGAWDVAMKI